MQTRVDTHIYSINKQDINKNIVTGANKIITLNNWDMVLYHYSGITLYNLYAYKHGHKWDWYLLVCTPEVEIYVLLPGEHSYISAATWRIKLDIVVLPTKPQTATHRQNFSVKIA